MSEVIEIIVCFLKLIYFWLEGMVLFFVPLKYKAKDIRGELVLITGAGSGIGRLMAVRFAKQGANLVLWDINNKGNEETAIMVREQGVKAYTYSFDVTDINMVNEIAAKVKKHAGIVTILVNNAGIVYGKELLDLDEKHIRTTFEVNVLSHFWIVKAFLPDMLNDHGHIVSMASLAGLGGIPKSTDYCASKFAAIGLMDALFVELHSQGRKNIRTTTICPFFTDTGMFTGASARFFNLLEPDYVAEQVIEAVLLDKGLVMIPRIFYFLYILKFLMPFKSSLALQDACGGSTSMSSFTGRDSKRIQ